jgi:hypothetical protein
MEVLEAFSVCTGNLSLRNPKTDEHLPARTTQTTACGLLRHIEDRDFGGWQARVEYVPRL